MSKDITISKWDVQEYVCDSEAWEKVNKRQTFAAREEEEDVRSGGKKVKFSTKEKTNQTREGSCHQTSCVVEKLSRRPHNENLLGLVKKFLHA